MKQITLISIVILSIFSCKAQQNIIPIFDNATPTHNPNNYYKDVDNDFDKFEGTWRFQNSSMEFKIVLVKKYAVNDNYGSYIYDMLIGEYLYSENNNVIVNTLSNISNPQITGFEHNIGGLSILNKAMYPRCPDCDISERRVQLLISDPSDRDKSGWLTLRYFVENGVEKLEANVEDESMMGNPTNPRLAIPDGNYILTKQ